MAVPCDSAFFRGSQVALMNWQVSRMHSLQAGERVHCLDMLRVESFCDCAILLEIWDSGGLLQTNKEIPKDTLISVLPGNAAFAAKVVDCQQDEFGFLIEISVTGPGWFPKGYVPPHLILN
jgi:hypothetical protein